MERSVASSSESNERSGSERSERIEWSVAKRGVTECNVVRSQSDREVMG